MSIRKQSTAAPPASKRKRKRGRSIERTVIEEFDANGKLYHRKVVTVTRG